MYTSKINFKKFTIIALLFAFLTLTLLAFVACDNTCSHRYGDTVVENFIESTETTDGGYDEVTYCTLCGGEVKRVHVTIPAHAHVAGEETEENIVSATCTQDGSYDEVVRCTVCDKVLATERKTTPKFGHDLTSHEAKEATCTESGYEAYQTCERCDYTTYTEIPAKHTPKEAVKEEEIPASCYGEGCHYDVVYCEVCHAELSREYVIDDKLEHDIIPVDEKDSTCNEVGWEAYEYCKRDNCGYTTYVEIAPKNHQNVSVEETFTPSTCTKAGGYDLVITCKDCGEITYQEHTPYDLADHEPSAEVKENERVADCYNDGGYDLVVHCVNPDCDYEFSRVPVSIPATHVPGEVVVENEVKPTYKYGGIGGEGGYDNVVYCKICSNEASREHITTKITAEEYYSQFDYLELSASVNSPTDLIDNGDGSYILNAKTNGGKEVRLLIVGKIGKLDGGWGSISENVKIYTLDALPGINYVDYEFSFPTANFVLGGYHSLSGKTSVDSIDELTEGNTGLLINPNYAKDATEAYFYPDYLSINENGVSGEIISMKIYYCNVMGEVDDIQLNSIYTKSMYKSYVEGDWYDGAIEKIGTGFDLPLNIRINNSACLVGKTDAYISLVALTNEVSFGSLRDVNGNAVDKNDRFLQKGDTIEVTVGNCTRQLNLCNETFVGNTLYEALTVGYIKSTGTQNVLVVPVTFNDQQDRIDDVWMTSLKGALGNVMDSDGNVTEYSLSNGNLSLSKHYYISSYGQLTINSFITEPYVMDGNAIDYYWETLAKTTCVSISEWLGTLDIDRRRFDQNEDGYYDVVIFVNTLLNGDVDGDGYQQMGMSGAYKYTISTDTRDAGTHDEPMVNTYLNVSSLQFFGIGYEAIEENAKTDALIHEFGHALGMDDYYNNYVTGNTIGYFDMEADNKGDWNSYTKYILGWIEPTIVDGSTDEVEITIRAYSTYGDAVVVHALGYDDNGTPFDEYVIIDLFAHDGLYEKDSAGFGLQDAVGVRIYHVNSVYDMTFSGLNQQSEQTVVAWGHHNTTADSQYAYQGKYLIEMIQKGKINTFMGETYADNFVDADDLFYEGDSFSAEEYDQFFYNGKMDNGMDFGYTITVKSIVENGKDSTATIVISKKSA